MNVNIIVSNANIYTNFTSDPITTKSTEHTE